MRVLKKFQEEQTRRQGGVNATYAAYSGAFATYIFSGWFLKVEKVPYKLLLSFFGYMGALYVYSSRYGDKKYQVYYTP